VIGHRLFEQKVAARSRLVYLGRHPKKMRSFRPILAIAAFFIGGCNQGEERVEGAESSPDSHRDAVAKFQDGKKRFKELIATVRDEEGFDAAKPELDKIVSDWREVAITLGELGPPSESLQAEVRALIARGNRAAEPSGEDILGLFSIESRETEVTRWLEEFAEAGGAAGAELSRLYGPIESASSEPGAPELELSNVKINGLPIDQWQNDPVLLIQKDQEAEQGDGGQTPPGEDD